MNNAIFRTIDLTEDWQPLSEQRLVVSVTISVPPGNAGPVTIRSSAEPEHEQTWIPGEWHELQRVDLQTIEVKGTNSDQLTIVGGTW